MIVNKNKPSKEPQAEAWVVDITSRRKTDVRIQNLLRPQDQEAGDAANPESLGDYRRNLVAPEIGKLIEVDFESYDVSD